MGYVAAFGYAILGVCTMTIVSRSYKIGFKAANAVCTVVCSAVAVGRDFVGGVVHAVRQPVRQRNTKTVDDGFEPSQPKPRFKFNWVDGKVELVSAPGVQVSEPDVVLNTTYHEI